MKKTILLFLSVLSFVVSQTMMAQVTLVDGHYVDPKQGLSANPTGNPDWSLMQGATVKKVVKGKNNAPIAPATSYGLPDHVNNGANKYFRNPVANQAGNSCGITSRHSHMMAYELNAYRDKDGSLPENMLPAHFAFVPAYREDPNKENYAKYVGIPDGATFGGTNVSTIYGGPYSESSNNYGRMQGYENWHKAMFNRITDNPTFPLGAMTEAGALAWKRWLYNHNGDESFHAGGVIGIGVASSGLDAATIASTTANNNAGVTGLYYLTHWGTGVDHAMVIVGYDDRIEFDLDGDGTYGSSSNHFGQNETGAWIACNSWGNWKNGGFIYVPYALASPTSTSYSSGNYSGYKAGDTNGWTGEVYKIRKAYTPIRTLKAAVAYSKRSEIQICVGISTNLNATSPDKTLVLANHNYHGDYDSNGTDAEVPMLGQWTDGKLHTEAMEFGYDLTDFTDEFNRHVPLKYFLIINTKSGASGSGQIEYASIMDYELNANGVETPFAGKNVNITNNGGTTTISTIVYGEELPAPANLALSGTTLSWEAPQGAGNAPTGYNIYQDGTYIANTTSCTYNIGSATGSFYVTACYTVGGVSSESSASNIVFNNLSASNFISYIGDPITSVSQLTSGSYVVLKCTGTRNKYVYDNGSGNAYALTAEAPELLDPDDYKYVFRVGTSGSNYTFQSINGYLPLGNKIDPRSGVQTLIVEQVSGSTNLFTFTNSSYQGTYYINGGESTLVVYSMDNNCKFYIYPVNVSITSTNTLNVSIAHPAEVYSGVPVQLGLEGAADIVSATWTVDGANYTGLSPYVTFNSTGSRSVSCTVTDSKNHSKEVSKNITVMAPSITANFTLSSASTTGSDRISFLSQNTVPGCTYSWSMPGAEETTATTRNASATYLSSGEKTVTLTVTGPNNSMVSHSETFMVNASAPKSRYTISPAVVVKNNPVTLTDNSLYEPTSWSWRFDSDNNRISYNSQSGTITPTLAGVYKLTFGTSNAMGSDFVEAERALVVCNSASGNGLTFAGGNQNVTASLSSALTTAWTIDFWFNPKSLGGSLQGITGSNTVSGTTRNFTLTSDANGIATLSVASQKVSTDAAFYIANEWHHYAITFSSGTVNFYRDGSLISTKSVSTTNFNNYFKNLQLGGSSASMDGSIDEFRVWNTTLTQENIRSYCVAPISASTSGLKLYWQMNQSTGNVTDATSNGVTGTRNNFNNDGDAWTDSEGVFALDFSTASNPTISDPQLNHYYDNVYSVTDEQDGNYQRGSLGLAFDGNTSSFYQSRWESGGYSSEASYPHSFILRRAALHEITAFSVVASSTPTNTLYSGLDASCGRAKYVTIEESDDATNWDYVDKEVRLYDLATNNVILPWPITKEYVRFTFSEPLYSDKAYAALVINEMNFYGSAVEPTKTEVPLTYVACSDESTVSSDIHYGSYALDGDASTFWHSSWYGTATAYPHTITIENAEQSDIDMFYFYQQHSYSGNQTGEYRAGVMNVATSSDNSSWTTVFEGLRIPYGNTGYVKLTESINARYVKLTFTRNQSSTGNGTYLAMNEIKAYGVENASVIVHVIDDTNIADNATDAVTAGSQITAEEGITSGKPYLVYYVGNGSSAYMKDTGSVYTGKSDTNPTKNAVYYFTTGGTSGTWNVQNYITGKYWGTPTANQNTYIGSDTAGDWALNFQSGNNIAPSCNGHSWNRSGSNIHPWSTGTANVNQFKIYEIDASSTALSEFTNKDIVVGSTAAETVQTGQWYVMFDRGAYHGYLYENSSSHTLYNTTTVPSGYAPDNAKYLVRIVGEGGNYYLQTGFGNYFGQLTQSTAVPTTALKEQLITIKKISDTDGHYYLQNPSNNIVLDANACNAGDATVVGWNTTVPTSTGGNNDWAFYPVELVDSWAPAIGDVYTINNTNAYRGAMMYNTASNYVWSSGKSGTFNASDANCQWVIVPTGVSDQYYLYNVGAGKFAIPSGTDSKASWIFSSDAVAVTLLYQSDGTYKIKTVTTDTYAAVSNGFDGPIINYNDVGGNFTITKVDGDASTAVNAALSKLVDNVAALSAVPASGSDGWYVIRIKTHGTYADKYIYPANPEITYSSTTYGLTFEHGCNVRPAIDNVAYYTRIANEENKVYWQLPNGKYLYGSGNKFPIPTFEKETFSMDYTSGFRMWGSSRYAVPYYLGSQYFIGETSNSSNAYYDIYPIDLATAGLTAWRVVINGSATSTQLTCSRSDVSGLAAVYNNGYFFLPSSVTPATTDFAMENMVGDPVIDATAKTITVAYDPTLCILEDAVTVNQGNQTTGKGNTMQALLRVKVTPFATCTPTTVNITLTGAGQLDHVAVYTTAIDEIRAEGANPTKISGDVTPVEGTLAIPTGLASALTANETVYLWVTADVKATATEWETVDAAITSIVYSNNNGDNTVDLTAKGDPDGEMRIYKQQAFLWTPTHVSTTKKYYRIPTILNTADGGIVAFTDDRYTSTKDLGNHKIDVVMRKSANGGLTWGAEQTIAAGDGSSDAAYGYGDPAVVRTLSGKLICIMAAGRNSFSSGMSHMGYSESTDNGATWSEPIDIYSSINKNDIAFQSVFTTAGKGVTFSNGRVAFAMNGKVSGTTNEYILYSDDEGATWTIMPTAVFTGADESKLEIMNDNSLLVSVRRGGFNSMANRGYNRSTGDASGDGINTWGTQGVWGNEMNANGCNADLLYYSRSTNGERDVLLHTLTKTFSTYRKDLRLYMSLDAGDTWTEVLQLQPGYAAYSSMQKLANGDLALIFEDGSIGNQDAQDCYAINYVVISKELLAERIAENVDVANVPNVKNSVTASTTGCDTYGTFSEGSSSWYKEWTSKASSGLAGVTVSTTNYVFGYATVYSQRVMSMRPSAAGTTETITITAPAGYVIDSYTITGRNYSSNQTYKLSAGSQEITTSTSGNTLTVENVNAQSTTFDFYGSSTSNYLCITNFVITLRKATNITLTPCDGKSYATLYLLDGVTLTGDVKAYKIALNDEWAVPTELGQDIPAQTPVLLYSTSAATSTQAIYNSNATADVDGNLLAGNAVKQHVDGYVLNIVGGVPGFYKLSSTGQLNANRAYLPSSVVTNLVNAFTFLWDDVIDAIGSVNNETPLKDAVIYELNGRRVANTSNLRRGIYIVNGKKVVVK